MAPESGRECRAHMILGMRNANCPTRSGEYPQSKRKWREKTERAARATQLNAVGICNKVMKRLISFPSLKARFSCGGLIRSGPTPNTRRPLRQGRLRQTVPEKFRIKIRQVLERPVSNYSTRTEAARAFDSASATGPNNPIKQ